MRTAAGLLVFLTACGFTPGSLLDDGGTAGSDGPRDTLPSDAMADALVLGAWTTASPVTLSGTGADDDPTLTADMLEMYFNRSSDIYMTTRSSTTAAWSMPTRVNELSDTNDIDTTPEITGDGLMIFIGSARNGTAGADDIWVSTRATRQSTWDMPTRVAELSSTDEDAASAPTDDKRAIVFTSARPNGIGFADLYYSDRELLTGTWTPPVNLDLVNSTNNDFSPMLSQDRLTLYFDSGRNGIDEQLYVATRTTATGSFANATPIAELNTGGNESDIWVSPDQRHMFFCRDGTLYESSR